MSKILFANNASTRLTAIATPTATTITVVDGITNIFPSFETGSEYFMLCLVNSDGTYEIMKCVGKTSGSFTVVRGQEGTKPIYFQVGALVEHRLTAGSLMQVLSNAHATTTTAGSVRIATDEEARTGITSGDGPAAVSPEQLKMFGVLSGTIVSFSGSFSGKNPIPRGQTTADTTWQICDGTNSTPDLRNKFVIGTGSSYPVDTTGGSSSHTHYSSGSVDYTTLSVSQMPSHSHYANSGYRLGCGGFFAEDYGGPSCGKNTHATGGSSPHSHSLSGVSTSTATNIPPYYSLSYIIKL